MKKTIQPTPARAIEILKIVDDFFSADGIQVKIIGLHFYPETRTKIFLAYDPALDDYGRVFTKTTDEVRKSLFMSDSNGVPFIVFWSRKLTCEEKNSQKTINKILTEVAAEPAQKTNKSTKNGFINWLVSPWVH